MIEVANINNLKIRINEGPAVACGRLHQTAIMDLLKLANPSSAHLLLAARLLPSRAIVYLTCQHISLLFSATCPRYRIQVQSRVHDCCFRQIGKFLPRCFGLPADGSPFVQ